MSVTVPASVVLANTDFVLTLKVYLSDFLLNHHLTLTDYVLLCTLY